MKFSELRAAKLCTTLTARCCGENFYALVRVIVGHIRSLRPQVVLTFSGDGGVNLHRDHTMVSAVATAAFHWAGRGEFPESALAPYAPQKLYYADTPFINVRDRPELSKSPTAPYSLTLELGDLSEMKLAAFGKHSTQAGVLERVGDLIRKTLAVERYLLVAAPGHVAIADDSALFAGVTPD